VLEDQGAGVFDVLDNGEGSLYFDEDDSGTINAGDDKVGTINYVTGEYDVDYGDAAPAVSPTGHVYADYEGYTAAVNQLYQFTTGLTNDLGSVSKRVTIPAWGTGDYYIITMDSRVTMAMPTSRSEQ
jgi:hypothetical protein